MFLENSFVPKNTPVHNLNPLVKFIVFLSIVFLLFLRISFLVQFLLLGFAGLVVWQSQCWALAKKIAPIYIVLFLFLFTVNFFFMKTPGFWTSSQEETFTDVFKIFGHKRTTTELQHGWFFGGEILKKSDGTGWVGQNIEELKKLEKYLGINTDSTVTAANTSDFSNLSSSTKWNTYQIVGKDGEAKYAAFSPVWYTVSSYQVIHAFSLANKLILIILLSSIFTVTMSFSSFAYALEDFFRPLKIFKLPTEVMALAVAISIRFVPSLIIEAFRIIRAQASRGIDYKNGKFRDKASALLSFFVPLFVISFIKAGELSEAMTARGYNHNHPINSFRLHIVRVHELLILFASMFFISMLYYLYFNSYYLGFFVTFERLSIMAK